MRPSIWSTVFAIPWITREYSQPHCSGGPFAINQAVEFNSCKALDSRASSILLNSDNDSNLRVNIYENEDCTGSVLRSGRECLDLGGLGSSAKSVMVVRGDGEGELS